MTNIVIVGVGGQGTLLASKILGYIGLENGYDVRVNHYNMRDSHCFTKFLEVKLRSYIAVNVKAC